ncbi:MAG: hypothetical protein Q8P81_04495 [Nanoarchaeota archaeon]|nr:hypothetical protein [Nanoarchaeota archaeon]
MVNIGFHYMNERRWNELNHDRNDSKTIQPRTRLVRLTDSDTPGLPDCAHEGYIFAFPDSEAPEPWKGYEHGKDEWNELTGNIGEKIVCVRFEILPSDEAYVVDRAHYADFQWRHNWNRRDAIRRYALSRVSAEGYDGSFRMPELLIGNPIALERLVLNNTFTREIVQSNGEWTIEYEPSPL